MQELVGRLTALDHEASEALKVVSYFDALIAGNVDLETIVRGAAALSGVPCGLRHGDTLIRVSPAGGRLGGTADGDWPAIDVVDGDVAWIERAGAPHANDAMVLERFALAVAISRARRRIAPEDSVHTLISPERTPDERAAAAARLTLSSRVRAVATAATAPRTLHGPSTVVATPHGVLRATIVTADSGDAPPETAWGTWGTRAELPESWDAALFARRLARTSGETVDAEHFGVLGTAARALDGTEHADARALASLDSRTLAVARALVESESIRAASLALGLHHSTVQSRHESLIAELGYDPRHPRGRARFMLADLLQRLSAGDAG